MLSRWPQEKTGSKRTEWSTLSRLLRYIHYIYFDTRGIIYSFNGVYLHTDAIPTENFLAHWNKAKDG